MKSHINNYTNNLVHSMEADMIGGKKKGVRKSSGQQGYCFTCRSMRTMSDPIAHPNDKNPKLCIVKCKCASCDGNIAAISSKEKFNKLKLAI